MAWRKAYPVVVGIAACMAVAGLCGTAGAAAALKPWKHGIVEAKGDSGILYMPARGGFAAKRGLDLQMVQFVAATTPVKAIMAGELDSFEGSPVVAFAAMAQGADLKIIGCHWPVMTYSLFARRDIASLRDLRGKPIGVSAPGSLPDLFAREALRVGGLGGPDVRFANAGSSADRFRAVSAGIVAAAGSSSEFEIEAPARGVKVLLRGAESLPNFTKVCLMSTGRKIAQRRADMVQYLSAAMEGYAYALKNRTQAIRLAHDVADLPATDRSATFVYDEVIKYKAVDPTMAISKENLQWSLDMMVRHGVIKQTTDVGRFIDDSLRQAALKLVPAVGAQSR